jgi:alkylated DNA repair protein alkB family protein 8
MKKEIAEKILQEIEQGYDLMSQKFSETRKYFWRGLEFIADYAKEGDKVLDFGCGNGRLLELIGKTEGMQYFGVDTSKNLIDIAKQHYQQPNTHFQKIHPVKSAEGGPALQEFNGVNPLQTTLPFTSDFFNTIYSIAVFHHFPSKKYRREIIKEMYRITKKEGYVVITVWNLWQKKYIKNIIDNWLNKIYLSFGGSFFIGEAGSPKWLDWNDCYIPFTDNVGNKFQRFHHAFTKKELKNLFKKAGFKVEKCVIIKERNILLVCKK